MVSVHVVVKVEASLVIARHEIIAFKKCLVFLLLIASLDISVKTGGVLKTIKVEEGVKNGIEWPIEKRLIHGRMRWWYNVPLHWCIN